MASSYHLTVKKYFDQNKIVNYSLPEYIQRGWNRIYTLEEQEFLKQSCIIGPDVQIPNSIVRQRLGTNQTLRKTNIETLRKAFELPDELFMNLSIEHQRSESIEDEKLSFQWNDDDDLERKQRKKSPMDLIIDKQREKRRKYEDYKYDYDNLEPLSIDEIVEEIRTNIGKDLKIDDIKLITELMQIISRNKNDQIMNIYDELTNIQLIDKFGGVPKLVQALQEIQNAFEQIAMKTNIVSIETVINILLEKDKTYRIAVELLNSFNQNIKKNKLQLKLNLNDKSGDISDHDHTVFNILIKDRISRLPVTDLTMLINDLKTIYNIDTSKVNNDRDDQVKFLSEQLNIIFIRAHLDGIKTILNTMKSPISISLREFIDKIENSLKMKLTEHDNIIVESYIHDHLTLLNENELKIVYERLAQQGTLKRLTDFNELNQSITIGLMKKIDTDGLGAIIENMKEAHLDINSMNELIQALTHINHHIQVQSSISLEQIQNQLGMAYFIETHNLREQDIHELSKAVNLYSIAHIPLSDEATKDECSNFLEHLKAPFIRKCIQRILNTINQEKTLDLNKVSSKFYNEYIVNLINELIHGSNEFNQNLVFHQIKEQLKKTKELPDKLYRQMLKEKMIKIDMKMKIDTDKKKIVLINDGINRILKNENDQIKQKQLIELFDRMNIPLSERIKHWYKSKANLQFASSKTKKDMIKKKSNVKSQIKIKSAMLTDKSKKVLQKTKDQLPTTTTTTTVISSSKRDSEQKKSLLKSQSKTKSIAYEEKRHSKTVDITKNEKMKPNSQMSIVSKSKDQQKDMLDEPAGQPSASSSTTIRTEPFNTDHTSKLQVEKQDDLIIQNPSSQITEETTENINSLLPKSNTVHKINQSNQNIESSEDTSIDVQLNVETKVEKNGDQSSTSQKIEIFQADLETIQSETTLDGKMGENKTLNFELNQAAACFLYQSPLLSDPKQEINIKLSSKTAEFTNDLPYEKTKAQRILAKTIPISTSHPHLVVNTIDTSPPASTQPEKLSDPPIDESSTKVPRRSLNRPVKPIDDYYINSLTKSLHNLFTRSDYNTVKLRKIHEELIASGHISPLNEFYRSSNEALRITLDHCVTYNELIKWTLSLLQTNNKPNLITFGHDLYSIAIDLDFTLTEQIDNTQCAIEIQENLKHQLQTITENDLREINSYINAAQLEKLVNISKKLNVTSKDRMTSDLNSFLLHLIQVCHTFESKYRPMQTHIREISEIFQSRAVADLARKLDEIEKHLSKIFHITFFGVSQRMNESQFHLV